MSAPVSNSNGERPLIGISMGDPLGIGPEVLVKALADAELRRRARFVIFGLHDVLEVAADQAEINPFWWREPYDQSVRIGSGVLLAQMSLAGRGDIYIPGDQFFMKQAVDGAFITKQVDAAWWVPVIGVRKGNPKKIASLADLARADIKVGLGEAKSCAIGRASAAMLERRQRNLQSPDLPNSLNVPLSAGFFNMPQRV